MIVIDGFVSAGKSTLTNLLKEEGFKTYPEPHLENPFLQKFYADRKRYSFASQIFFLNKKFEFLKEIKGQENVVLDRGIHGDYLFAKTLYDLGDMSKEEFNTYKELFGIMLDYIDTPKLIVYLDISTDYAVERIKKRGRDFEQNVDLKYWTALNNNYKEYFRTYSHSPIITLSTDNLNYENNQEHKKNAINLIYKNLKK